MNHLAANPDGTEPRRRAGSGPAEFGREIGAAAVVGELVQHDVRSPPATASKSRRCRARPRPPAVARPRGACSWPCRAAVCSSTGSYTRMSCWWPASATSDRWNARCAVACSLRVAARGRHPLDGGARGEPGQVGDAAAASAHSSAKRSSTSRRLNSSSMSRADSATTRTPRRGRCSTSPCCPSSRSASRSGARLIPNRRVSCSSTSRSPGAKAPPTISPQPADGQLDQALRLPRAVCSSAVTAPPLRCASQPDRRRT